MYTSTYQHHHMRLVSHERKQSGTQLFSWLRKLSTFPQMQRMEREKPFWVEAEIPAHDSWSERKHPALRNSCTEKLWPPSLFLFVNSHLEQVAGSKNLIRSLLFSFLPSFPTPLRALNWSSTWFSSVETALLHPKQISTKAIGSLVERYLDLYNDTYNADLSPVADDQCCGAHTSSFLTIREGQMSHLPPCQLLHNHLHRTVRTGAGRAHGAFHGQLVTWAPEIAPKCVITAPAMVPGAIDPFSACSVDHVVLHQVQATPKQAVWDVTIYPGACLSRKQTKKRWTLMKGLSFCIRFQLHSQVIEFCFLNTHDSQMKWWHWTHCPWC